MKKIITIGVLILPVFLAASCNNAGSQSSSTRPASQQTKTEITLTADQQAAGAITTQAVTLTDAPEMLPVTGRIVLADDRTWRVGVRTDGIVIAIYAGLGDHVEKGQVLARYHADEVRETRAQYRKALAELNRLQAAEALAQRNYDRAQTLLSLKAASVQQVEQARQELLAAQMAVRAGQVEVDRGKDLLEDDLRVPADPLAGQQDETSDDVPIIAPASGYIIEKNITPGKAVQTSTDTFVIGDVSQVWMLASVRQENLGELRLGQAVTVTLAGLAGQRFRGQISNLGQELDPRTRTMQVRIVLNNSQNRLKPEMLATAEIPAGEHKQALLVPSDALQQINDQDVLFVREAPDRFVIRPVQVGEAAEGKTQILRGLSAGEQVVVKGSFLLKSQLLKSTIEGE